LKARATRAEAEVAKLQQALERYGSHSESCKRYRHDFKVQFRNAEPTCLCGYSAALAAGAAGGQPEDT
jgi:hypothetical protein